MSTAKIYRLLPLTQSIKHAMLILSLYCVQDDNCSQSGMMQVVGTQTERQTEMGMLRVMSRRGDERVEWDLKKVETSDPEAIAAIREAERIFNEERTRGATAFKVEAGKPVERIEKFDRTAEQIVMVPRVVGG
jgi:hypothetical protein